MNQKIYITQGYEKGIGLEVFQKAHQCLDSQLKKKIIFVGRKDNLDINIENVLEVSEKNKSQTLSALDLALSKIQSNDFLITLPSNKDQFDGYLGHTEYLRHFYQKPDLGMSFVSPRAKILLLSDHISLSKVTSTLNAQSAIQKIQSTLLRFPEIDEVILAGINPHAGEDGLLGTEEILFNDIQRHIHIKTIGPYSADTLMFKHKSNKQLFVFAYHDQGLTVFKKLYGLFGLNITTGLDYWRISVDHGTAPDIFGKNQANYQGMNYLFEFINEKIYRSS